MVENHLPDAVPGEDPLPEAPPYTVALLQKELMQAYQVVAVVVRYKHGETLAVQLEELHKVIFDKVPQWKAVEAMEE